MAEPEAPWATGRAGKRAVSPASDAAAPPATFDALCNRHGELLEGHAEDRLDPAAVAAFVHDAAAAGVQIESVTERDAIRSMLNYWTATLARLPAAAVPATAGGDEPLPAVERSMLASFDASQSPDLDDKDNPFVGLAPFDVGQSDVFFGRDRVVADLLELIRNHGLIVVSGSSGTGKSSLVRAGLTGAVRADPRFANWIIGLASPGRDPVASLVAALAPSGPDVAQWVEAGRARLDADPAEAGALAAKRMGDGDLLLIVDQLEELFSLCPPEDRDHATSAIAAIAALPRAHVVVTIRDEYLEGERAQRVLPTLDLGNAKEFRIPPLDPSEIRAAIVEPAARAGLVFQDGLIDRIVAEVGTDPAALPLLQYALLRMWHKRQGNRITFAIYEQVGGPATALSKAAQEIYDGFMEQARHNTQIIFQQLVRPSLVYEFVRDRVTRGELERLLPPDSIRTVVRPFVDAGLIRFTPGSDRSQDRIEIAHEALIRNWDPLRRWAGEVRDRERLFLEIDARAERWDESGHARGHLLLFGALKNAEREHKQYRSRARVDPIANDRVERYIAASRTLQRRLLGGLATVALTAVLLFFLLSSKYIDVSTKYIDQIDELSGANTALTGAKKIIDDQDTELQAETGESVTDDDAARQFIQMLLSRGTISRNELPTEFASMAPAAFPLSTNGWPVPFDHNFLGIREDIFPTVARRRTVLLKLPNLRVFYDPETGTPLLAISQNDRTESVISGRHNALYRWPGLAGQLDEQALAQSGLVLARLVDRREVAWGLEAPRAAMAVNFLPTMVPMRQQRGDRNPFGDWSELGASLRENHNPLAKRVLYFSGSVPSAQRNAPPQKLWKVAVSVKNGSDALVAEAFMLPARRSDANPAGQTTLDEISAVSGIDFSRLKAVLGRSAAAAPASREAAPQATVSGGASATSVYIQVHNVSDEQATAIRLALAGQGLRMPPVQQVNSCISPAQLRYYYPEDANAAQSARVLAEAAMRDAKLGNGTIAIKNFDVKRFPEARPGNLELWICGSTKM